MKKKLLILTLMVAAVFSVHARKLLNLSMQADNSAGAGVTLAGPAGGGATCET